MAERCVRDAEVGSSNLPHPTQGFRRSGACGFFDVGPRLARVPRRSRAIPRLASIPRVAVRRPFARRSRGTARPERPRATWDRRLHWRSTVMSVCIYAYIHGGCRGPQSGEGVIRGLCPRTGGCSRCCRLDDHADPGGHGRPNGSDDGADPRGGGLRASAQRRPERRGAAPTPRRSEQRVVDAWRTGSA